MLVRGYQAEHERRSMRPGKLPQPKRWTVGQSESEERILDEPVVKPDAGLSRSSQQWKQVNEEDEDPAEGGHGKPKTQDRMEGPMNQEDSKGLEGKKVE